MPDSVLHATLRAGSINAGGCDIDCVARYVFVKKSGGKKACTLKLNVIALNKFIISLRLNELHSGKNMGGYTQSTNTSTRINTGCRLSHSIPVCA